jgi:hypothetical protein
MESCEPIRRLKDRKKKNRKRKEEEEEEKEEKEKEEKEKEEGETLQFCGKNETEMYTPVCVVFSVQMDDSSTRSFYFHKAFDASNAGAP